MSSVARSFVLGAIVVAVLVAATIYIPSLQPGLSSSSTSVSSTTVGTTSSTTSVSQTSTTTTTSTTVVNGSFAVFPTDPVRIGSVQAVISPGQSGMQPLYFRVVFTNGGTSTIYVVAGCGSDLNSTITSGSDVVKTTTGGPRCLCAEYMSPVAPGQSHTSTDPGCWSPYGYLLEKPGTFSASLTLYWSGNSQPGGTTNHVTITATFNVL